MTDITKRHDFLEAVRFGNIDMVRNLQPHFCHPYPILAAIDLAVLYDQQECLTFLLSVADNNPISVDFPTILHSAVISGRDECVGIVLPYVNDEDVKFELAKLMRTHKMVGFSEMYARIAYDQVARQQVFLEAVLNNHQACVRLVLPTVDPKFNDSVALQVACLRGHTDLIDLLYPLSDVGVVVKALKDGSYDCSILEDKIQQERLHTTLCDVTSIYGDTHRVRKI